MASDPRSSPADLLPPAFDICVAIHSDSDIVSARQKGRELARTLGFSAGQLALIATAISELARNILLYAHSGTVALSRLEEEPGLTGLLLVAEDSGPGIEDISRAMQDGFSTRQGLGLGLPGVKRIMDRFELSSTPGQGTRVTAVKWVP